MRDHCVYKYKTGQGGGLVVYIHTIFEKKKVGNNDQKIFTHRYDKQMRKLCVRQVS